uniref:Ig-like domain-containing protein n=1 Tax=Labrus bergylta TaxID=56723 RepID=A0A3Q3G844_9LABR
NILLIYTAANNALFRDPFSFFFLLLIKTCSFVSADSSCPPESNPLTLDPPVVVGELGETVGVNCSSVNDNHYGMYWRTRNTDSELEEENSFIAESLQLSDWNTAAECKIKLNETYECSKELEIIMYKNPDVSLYPTKYLIDLVEGTPFELQCDIIEVAPVQKLTVRWYKGKQIIKTNTFSNTTKRPVEESSILMVNISRGDHGAQFRCEAQLDFGPHGVQTPVISKTHQVSATTPTPTYPEVSTSAAPDTSTPTISESPTPATEASTPAYTEASTARGEHLCYYGKGLIVYNKRKL